MNDTDRQIEKEKEREKGCSFQTRINIALVLIQNDTNFLTNKTILVLNMVDFIRFTVRYGTHVGKFICIFYICFNLLINVEEENQSRTSLHLNS